MRCADARRPGAGLTAPAEPPTRALTHYLRPGTLQLGALPPLSLYVHLPWCLKKCPYCDFNSHRGPTAASRARSARYLDALRADLEAALPLVWGRPRRTASSSAAARPACSRPDGIDRLLADMRARLPLAPGCEVTLEANPGTFERDRFRAFRAAGVTRLSIGVQSFDDAALQPHRPRARRAPRRAPRSRKPPTAFDTFNLDLMYALPGQDLAALGARPGRRAGLRAAAPVGLPPDAGAEHRVRAPAAGAARRRHRPATCST